MATRKTAAAPVPTPGKNVRDLSQSASKLRAELDRIEKTARHEADPRAAVTDLARVLGEALGEALDAELNGED